MEKPNPQELEALAELMHLPKFQKVISWFERSLIAQRKRNDVIKEDFLLRQGQGKAQTLSTIVDTIANASNILRKLR